MLVPSLTKFWYDSATTISDAFFGDGLFDQLKFLHGSTRRQVEQPQQAQQLPPISKVPVEKIGFIHNRKSLV